jgi:hypothetical protein
MSVVYEICRSLSFVVWLTHVQYVCYFNNCYLQIRIFGTNKLIDLQGKPFGLCTVAQYRTLTLITRLPHQPNTQTQPTAHFSLNCTSCRQPDIYKGLSACVSHRGRGNMQNCHLYAFNRTGNIAIQIHN